jgi:uncharacterized protein YciI
VKSFLLLAYDYQDSDSYARRMKVRSEHIACIDQLRDSGKALLGAAILDDSGKMIGSTIFLKMTDEELKDYLDKEPYLTAKVWEKVEIKECQLGPSFCK